MKNETIRKDNPSQNDEGFPIQAILLLVIIGIAILATVLKAIGVF